MPMLGSPSSCHPFPHSLPFSPLWSPEASASPRRQFASKVLFLSVPFSLAGLCFTWVRYRLHSLQTHLPMPMGMNRWSGGQGTWARTGDGNPGLAPRLVSLSLTFFPHPWLIFSFSPKVHGVAESAVTAWLSTPHHRACRSLVSQAGVEPMPLPWKFRVLTNGPPWKSLYWWSFFFFFKSSLLVAVFIS